MSKEVFYVVKVGRTPGIYKTWEEASEQIKGFSKPQFIKKATYEEALAEFEGRDFAEEQLTNDLKTYDGVIFTDGGYNKSVNKYYGAYIVFDKNKKKYTGSLVQNSNVFGEDNNVAGEALACINAIETAVKLEMKSVILYYDYQGLEKFANGEWKPKKNISNFYVNKIKELFEFISIKFQKVSAHCNNKYNDLVDSMASEALIVGKGKKCKVGVNITSVSNCLESDFNVIFAFIKDELKDEIKILEMVDDSTKIIRKISFKDEKLTCTFFKTTRKIMVQGKSSDCLFQIFISLISDLIDNVDIISVLSKAYEFGIDEEKILLQEQSMFIYPFDYPHNLMTLIKQSIANLNYSIKAFDYAMFAYSAMRALDGHMKYMLMKNGIVIEDDYYIFKKDNSFSVGSKLQNGKKYVINQNEYFPLKKVYSDDKIEDCYNYYKSARDSIFHFGTVQNNGIDDSKMFSDIEKARACIRKVLDLIRDTL